MARRTQGNFTLRAIKRRLKALFLELAAIGGAYDQSAGELRRRVLALQATVHELIARFPEQ
jgi:hypothetical protein